MWWEEEEEGRHHFSCQLYMLETQQAGGEEDNLL